MDGHAGHKGKRSSLLLRLVLILLLVWLCWHEIVLGWSLEDTSSTPSPSTTSEAPTSESKDKAPSGGLFFLYGRILS